MIQAEPSYWGFVWISVSTMFPASSSPPVSCKTFETKSKSIPEAWAGKAKHQLGQSRALEAKGPGEGKHRTMSGSDPLRNHYRMRGVVGK